MKIDTAISTKEVSIPSDNAIETLRYELEIKQKEYVDLQKCIDRDKEVLSKVILFLSLYFLFRSKGYIINIFS